MISFTKFDPFNHGTTSIIYRPISGKTYEYLSQILQRGWNIFEIPEIEEHDVGPKINSNNYKIVTGRKKYLLKISHLRDSKSQSLINNCLLFCQSNGALTADIILTTKENTFFQHMNKIYCLYDFIDGDNFDGSKEELKSAAKETAKLISTLENLPMCREIKIRSSYLCHNAIALKMALQKAMTSTTNSKTDLIAKNNYQEIMSNSKIVSEILSGMNSQLPKQVIHGDLHPHNMIFDRQSKQLLAILDFDVLKYSQKIRSVAFAMHRLCRTYGPMTEKQNDLGEDIQVRIKLFLDTYLRYDFLKKRELEIIGIILQDESLNYIEKILRWHYLEDKTEWSFDLEKRITTLLEAKAFF